jgi:FkbM family methyltransferase
MMETTEVVEHPGLKLDGGIWLPATETHMVENMRGHRDKRIVDGKLTYQYKKLEALLEYVKNWRTAVDVGGHCGLWSMHLVKRFQHVHAFEPVPIHREAYKLNVGANGNNYTLHACAMGNEDGEVQMSTYRFSTGSAHVGYMDTNEYEAGEKEFIITVPLKRLDSFGLKDVDLMKLDCEGYELFTLQGGEELLKANKPAIVVEQKPGRGQKYLLKQTAAVDYLQSLGAVLRKEMSGDFIMSWD